MNHLHRCGYGYPRSTEGLFGFYGSGTYQKISQIACGFVWKHPDPTGQVPHEEYEERHTCPNCKGVVTYWKYEGRYQPGQGVLKK